MAASVKAQPRSVVDLFAKLAASGEPIPSVDKVPLSQKGTTMPTDLVTHIFSFALPKVHANFSGTCKAAYFHLKSSLTAREILAVVGDQSKHYPIRVVVQKITAFVKLFPNLRELNCRYLQLTGTNRASRDLIPSLMRAWPRDLHSVTVPYQMGAPGERNTAETFAQDVMGGIYQALTPAVQRLDLRVYTPASVQLQILETEQIDCSRVTRLAYAERDPNSSPVFNVFTQLRHLTVALQGPNQMPLVSFIIREGILLETLTLENESGNPGAPLTLCSSESVISTVPHSRLRQVELIGCAVYGNVMSFFKRVSPDLALRLTRCRIELPSCSFSLDPKALQNFTL